MAKIVIPFDIGEDDVNTLDGTPVTIATFGGDTILRMPLYLKMWREAGTAYSITRAGTGNVYQPQGTVVYHPDDKPLVDTLQPADQLIVYDLNNHLPGGRSDRNNIMFRVPVNDFLDTALDASFAVLPESGLLLHPGATTVKIESLVSLSGGTGTVRGELVFEEIGF